MGFFDRIFGSPTQAAEQRLRPSQATSMDYLPWTPVSC